ncbi:MAG: hypothetical protein NTAFB01_18350 [Nitrospira sp.]
MLDDFDVIDFGHGGIAVVIQLEDFTFGHFVTSLGEDFIDPLALKLNDFAHGFGIEIITYKDADLVSPHLARGSSASPKIGVIHDVIV